MTRKLFWEDMYMKEFEANVISSSNSEVILDATAFYPRSGGLISDTGIIERFRVEEVFYRGDEIIHRISGGSTIEVGRVKCAIDWDKRYRVMRMHTATHILSSIVNRESGAFITGNRVGPDISHVDFSLENFERDKLAEYVEKVNKISSLGLEVKTYFLKREDAMKIPGIVKLASAMPPNISELRIVQIGDFDIQADGGVHVKNTSEIGRIKMVKVENKGKNNRRVYFSLE
jgi:Ser-tRNA(Ala) deacylase AlaX